MIKHLLVTNDFPPKHGGIQSYLWELWRRLPPNDVTVMTTTHPGAEQWDAAQPFRIVRTRSKVLLPAPGLARQIDDLADDVGAALVLLDPALPLGLVGPRLRHPYGLVLHGAEVTVPGRLPVTRFALRRLLRGAKVVICAGGYPLTEAERAANRSLPATNVPPGVDIERFRPLTHDERVAAREQFGLPVDAPVILGLSRLVPRKGFDTLLRACGEIAQRGRRLVVAIAGDGRDRARLERIAHEAGAPARFLGRIDDDAMPALYGASDVFAMLCRNRWAGLEQEGFGIVFLEAAAAGVPQVAGASGGAAEAVVDGASGFVVDPPDDVAAAARALTTLLDDDSARARMGETARERAVAEFSYDVLVTRLQSALDGVRG
ncbi:MAG: phosphatidyl-myo-inositol dimannoside synthase [Acidimicrobiaceae bacterium]